MGEGEVVGEGSTVQVEFLLVSNRRTRWKFGELSTVGFVKERVWSGWPVGEFSFLLFNSRESC